jgi:hypothetical protein
MTDSRKNLFSYWGPEIVVQCCRYWKLHWGNGTWGSCGICRKKPTYVNLTWDDIDRIQTDV